MTKIFISQPMNGREQADIIKERQEITTLIEHTFLDPYVLDSFVENAKNVNPLFCLGYAIQVLSKADYAFFADGWQDSRGCRIEHECCEKYGIKALERKDLKDNIYPDSFEECRYIDG